MGFTGLPTADLLASVALFGERVLPRLRAATASPIQAVDRREAVMAGE